MSAPLFPDVVVNGQRIPAAQVAAEAQHHAAPRGKPGLAWRAAARAMAVRALLLQEARRRGLRPAPAELAPGRFETEEEALIRALLDEAVAPPAPDEAAVRAEWARDPGRFRAPPLWEVSHILVQCDPRDAAAREAALRRARELAERVRARPRDFARIAQESSDCASRAAGGALGQLRPGDCAPEFEAALRRMSPGEITAEPVLSRHGWHVIRLEARADGPPLPYEAARGRILEAMEKAAWARAARAFVAELAARAQISGVDLAPPHGAGGAAETAAAPG
ncbi:peptidylprolyl isomerase [Oceanicella actignis]|uniref:Parvulin-like PPIase n=1 Tax=Oceanicella actignis TaxID=1189325 RepID=A0A1M7SDC6_9RHOB|nr:peptidylprolyl isomerase [Oceanicella actignis]SET25231.1 peptidyl-prolyl cis-trans isomerase C [Oceanicella actignis]SHN56501.1 peptidyl-prolyl cis-trans isomerase C [Oceanicella actignis]